MPDIKIAAADGVEFDCHVTLPASGSNPALVIMSSIFGVNEDVREAAADLAEKGVVVAAPDLFARTDPGPMDRSEDGERRARERSADRVPLIEQAVKDLADVIAVLKAMPECNGRIAVLGLCYGGPFAFLGPSRLGCDAGLAFHGTAVQEYLDEVPKVGDVPIRLHWGDEDTACPPEALAAVRAATEGMANVEITIYPGVHHGYSGRSSPKGWNEAAAADSWASALAVIDTLRDTPQAAQG
jgi:carboxymethylenebutenolidase